MENKDVASFLFLLIQLGTLFSSTLFYKRIFQKEESRLMVFFGTLLYMTCPYRIYVCDIATDLSQPIMWMLLPLYAWAVAGIVLHKGNVKDTVVAGLALAGIGYADMISFLIMLGVTLLVGFFLRKPWSLVPVFVGSVFFSPGLYHLAQYLFTDHYQGFDIPIQSIMEKGYRFGEYFQSYAFREGHPGMGLGLLVCLLSGLWMRFVYGEKCKTGVCRFFGALSLFLMPLSFYRFPWDMLQRLGGWSLKFVSLISTPAVFAGMAFVSLSVPAAWSIARINRHENKEIAYGVPVAVLIFCIGLCIYQCVNL